MQHNKEVYCKTCEYAGQNIHSDTCCVPCADVIQFFRDHGVDVLPEFLKLVDESGGSSLKLHMSLFDTEDAPEKHKTIGEYLKTQLYYRLSASDDIKQVLSNAQHVEKAYGAATGAAFNELIKYKMCFLKPGVLNAKNDCPFYTASQRTLVHRLMLWLGAAAVIAILSKLFFAR